MSQATRTTYDVGPFFHTVSHYNSPADVLKDARLSTDEKRVVLSSWASDMYAVESHPDLREVLGIPQRLRLDDILAALKRLDDDMTPPPRGGLAMRLPRFSKLDCVASDEPQRFVDRHASTRRHRSIQASRTPSHLRWTREANVRRYRKLLNTRLTDIECNFIERRLAEELRG
jgi:DNA-binding transcriptional ArsR family regulator